MNDDLLAQEIRDLLLVLGPWAPALLGGASLIEYVFPPFPGDTVTLAGGVLAVRGVVGWTTVGVSLVVGNLLGIAIDWGVGRWLARRRGRLPDEARRPWWSPLSVERFERFELAYRRWGDGLLLANRFLPAARAFFFLAAGAAGLSLRRTMALGLASALAWNLLILGLGALVGGRLEDVLRLARSIGLGGWIVLACAVVLGLIVRGTRSRRAARRRRGECSGPSGRP